MEHLVGAIYRPPAKQGDIVSDLVNYHPARLLLIDGEFRQNLSVWHKELVYALQYPGLKAVYGAASIGALRAAELDYLGMIGVGKIYEWYRDGVTEDDSEVAVNFTVKQTKKGPVYQLLTVPLADIRAGVELFEEIHPNDPISAYAREFLEEVSKVYYMDRTPALCKKLWDMPGIEFPCVPRKEMDAEMLLASYGRYERKAAVQVTPDHLSHFFHAQFERDRRIRVNGVEVPQANIEAHVILHNPEYERICWDSSNQELALALCDALSVMVTIEEVARESERFQLRAECKTQEEFNQFIDRNGWSKAEYDRLMIQNARIRKLQHAVTVSKLYRRNTQAILDYLRTHDAFEYWAKEAVVAEERLKQIGVDDWLAIDMETPVFNLLLKHFENEGLELKANPEDYLLETGFSNMPELGVALARINAGKEQK
jgi:hypothetical protein